MLACSQGLSLLGTDGRSGASGGEISRLLLTSDETTGYEKKRGGSFYLNGNGIAIWTGVDNKLDYPVLIREVSWIGIIVNFS